MSIEGGPPQIGDELRKFKDIVYKSKEQLRKFRDGLFMPKDQMLRFKGLTPNDLAALRAKHIQSPIDVWSKLQSDPNFLDNLGLADEQDKKRVATLLAAEARRRSQTLTRNPVVVHAPDIALILLLFLILGAVYFVHQNPATKHALLRTSTTH